MWSSVRLLSAALALVVGVGADHAEAQSAAPSPTPAVTMWGPNEPGPMARVGNTLYLGGGFDYIGPPTGSLAIVDAADATQINTAARLLNATSSVVADGTGGWFVAPVEQNAFAEGALALKHILPSGAVDPAWTMPALTGGMIVQTFVDGPRVYIAGSFTAVGGVAREGLAALDVATGAVLPFNTTRNIATVYPSVFIDGGFVYLSGLNTAGGTTVVLDGVTGADVPFAAPGSFITAASGARVYGLSQNPSGRLDAFDRAGVPLPGWVSPTFSAEIVRQVVANASRVFVQSYGNNISRITAYDALTGALLPSWSPPTFTLEAATNSLDVWTIALDGDTLHVGGTFSAVNGQVRSRVAALDATTGAVTAWAPLVGGRVTSLAVGQGRVAVGGWFSSAGGITRKYLAAIDLTTGLPIDVVPAVTRPITALIASGDLVLAAEGSTTGGEVFGFSAASGVKYPAVLPFAGNIAALEFAGTRVYMGGSFAFGPEPARSLAVFDLAGGGLLPWTPVLGPIPNPINPSQPFPPRVTVMRARLGRLYVGGFFTSANGVSRDGGAAFDLDSLALAAWNPRNGSVGAVEVAQNRMLISANGTQGRWVDPVSGDDLGVPPTEPSFATSAIARSADTFILAGSTSSTAPGASLAVALDARTGQPLPWNVTMSGGVSGALGFDDLVVLRGFINRVGQEPAANVVVFRTTPPAPPRNLTFDASQPVVTMGWTAGGGSTTTAFVLEAGSGSGLADFGRFAVGPVTRVSAQVGPGTYALRVFAVGPTGTSAPSSEILFTRPAPSAPPIAPGGLAGAVSAGVVSLSWTPSADATTYVIEGGSAAGLTDLGVLPTGVLDTNIAGPVPPGTYFLRVRAANRFGSSAASNEVRVVVP